jgi:DNA-directed RNA polymerase specialized sigma24 family protein
LREVFRGPSGVPDRKQNLPQLYRFCYLMLGDSRKAQEVFHATLRDAGVRAARGEVPTEPFWLFRDARWRCLEATKTELQPESFEMDERDVAPEAASQIERLDPMQLAVWISAAPDPQRSALALFYLDEFDYQDILDLAELKLNELSRFLAKAGNCRRGLTPNFLNQTTYENAVVNAPSTRPFELRTDQRASTGRPFDALGNISCGWFRRIR